MYLAITLENDVITNECWCIVLIFFMFFSWKYVFGDFAQCRTKIVRNILEHWRWSLLTTFFEARMKTKKQQNVFLHGIFFGATSYIQYIENNPLYMMKSAMQLINVRKIKSRKTACTSSEMVHMIFINRRKYNIFPSIQRGHV